MIQIYFNINALSVKKINVFLSPEKIQMIQRIQTLYLILASICSSALIFVMSLWKENGVHIYAIDLISSDSMMLKVIPFLFISSALLSLFTIFKYQKRKSQFVLNRLNILINLMLLGVCIYYLLMLPGETNVSEKGIGALIPIVVILLLVLANRAIYKDENLVKSVDRLR